MGFSGNHWSQQDVIGDNRLRTHLINQIKRVMAQGFSRAK